MGLSQEAPVGSRAALCGPYLIFGRPSGHKCACCPARPVYDTHKFESSQGGRDSPPISCKQKVCLNVQFDCLPKLPLLFSEALCTLRLVCTCCVRPACAPGAAGSVGLEGGRQAGDQGLGRVCLSPLLPALLSLSTKGRPRPCLHVSLVPKRHLFYIIKASSNKNLILKHPVRLRGFLAWKHCAQRRL